jgi:hypothetical protein
MTGMPKQVEHSPKVQSFLDRLLDCLDEAVYPQENKNPECEVEAGSSQCLNAADATCNSCGWWDELNEDDE